MQAELVKTSRELPDVLSLWFKTPSGFKYTAGDYTELSLGIDGVEDRRWLSLASAPSEPNLQFTVKLGKPLSKFKSALISLKPGQNVYLSPPMGNFNAPRQPDKLLFVAGGVGITPFRSIIVEESKHTTGHNIELFYAAKPNQFLFKPETKKTRLTKFNSGTKSPTLEDIRRAVTDVDERIIFLAGPQPMMQGFYDKLVQTGHPLWRLRLCYFDNYLSV